MRLRFKRHQPAMRDTKVPKPAPVAQMEDTTGKNADRIIVFKDGCIIEDSRKEGGENYLA